MAADTYSPGYLGPGSYALLLPQEDGSEVLQQEVSASSDSPEHELTHQYTLKKAVRREIVTGILSTLRNYAAIQELVLQYNASNEAGVIPAQLQIDAINAIGPFVDKHNLQQSPPSTQLVDQIMENSRKPLCVTKITNPRDLHKACSGDSLRLETIGFLLATAGRSLTFGFSLKLFSGHGNRGLRARLIDELLSASTQCITITSLIGTVNDVTVWMYYENYLFTTMVCGYSGTNIVFVVFTSLTPTGPPSWRRINDLATQIYALGMHKESPTAAIPRWLTETRRRVFCSSYNQDKAISTFLGRPIRISKRHSDTPLPLDLRDDELTGAPAALDAAIRALDPHGWNTHGQHLRASWIRLRHIASRLREEILDIALSPVDSAAESSLLSISARVKREWALIPAHMRYTTSVWTGAHPPAVCLMLVVIHLTHWYNEFMIQKLLDYVPLTANEGMLRVSVDLLSNVLALGAMRDQTYDVHRDVLHCILLYGIPSASVLATALRQQASAASEASRASRANGVSGGSVGGASTTSSFPPGITRSAIIRHLSVLIAHLDASSHLENSGARAGEANHALCRRASRIFTRVIDDVLDPAGPADGVGNSAADGADGFVERGGFVDAAEIGDEMGMGMGVGTGMGMDLFGGLGMEWREGEGGMGGAMEMGGVGFGVGDGVDWGVLGQWTL